MQNSSDSDLLDSCCSSISSMSMLDNTSDDTLTPESVTGEVLSESTKQDEKYLSSIRENEGIRLQLEAISQLVESKNQELMGLIAEKERTRANEERRVRNAHESRKKCTKCGGYVAQIVNLRKEYKQKKRALKQERERLQNQLDANRSTIHFWENEIEQEKEKNKNALRDLEDKLQQEIARLNERTNYLQTENESQIRAIIELEKRSKNAEECILQEGEVEKKAMNEKIKAQAEKIEELEQMSKNAEECILQEGEVEKKAMNEKIKAQAEKIEELEQMVEQRTNALESAQTRIANQRKIHNGMVNRSNELEDQVDAVNAELIRVRDAARTQINNLHLFIGALQHLVNQFRMRLQDFEYREQNDLALRDELLEILDDLQGQPNRPPNVPNIIFALHVEDEVHIPD